MAKPTRQDLPLLPDSMMPSVSSLSAITDLLKTAYRDVCESQVAPRKSLPEIEQVIAGIDFSSPIGIKNALCEAEDLMKSGDLLSASPRCFGYFNPTSAWPAVAADVLVSARNPQICVTSHAPASVTMERAVMKQVLQCLSMGGGTGHFTSGGSEANETALLSALCRANPDFIEGGMRSFSGSPVFYISKDSHLAWIKIAKSVGMGSKSVRLVATNGRGVMDVVALERAIQSDKDRGCIPVMIVATCGTTGAGMVDPLTVCADIAKTHDLHYHIDAAWAGALIFDNSRRSILAGMELADSVTIDAHKWLSVPMGTGMIALRDGQYAANVFSVQTSYMPQGDGEDLYITTNQWSRRFLGLRLWMMLRTLGMHGYRVIFDRHFALADYIRQELPRHGWVIRNDSILPVIVFDDAGGIDSQRVADVVESRGRAWVGRVNFEGHSVLRACTTSFLSEYDDVDVLISELNAARDTLR